MVYDVLDVAKYVVTFCAKENHPISNLELQRILYYIQGYLLAVRNEPAFEEDMVAWRYGPMVRKVYDFFSRYAATPIKDSFQTDVIRDEKFEKVMQLITLKYCSVWKLEKRTHQEAPWQYTVELYGMGSVIPKEYIKLYFRENYI